MLCIRSPELTHLLNAALYPLTNISSIFPAPSNDHSTLCFYEFSIFRFYMYVISHSICLSQSTSLSIMPSRFIRVVRQIENFLPSCAWVILHYVCVCRYIHIYMPSLLWLFLRLVGGSVHVLEIWIVSQSSQLIDVHPHPQASLLGSTTHSLMAQMVKDLPPLQETWI